MWKFLKNRGPGAIVTAAFIGPGTLTVCTIAGVEFGYELLWALIVSIFATIVLQEMAARLGLVSQKGLTTVIRQEITHPIFKVAALLLIVSAIVIGNTAYEAGNISGSALGLGTLLDKNGVVGAFGININLLSIIVGTIAFVLLFVGSYKVIQKLLTILVVIMSATFLITAILSKPDIVLILKGMLIPNLDKGKLLTAMALVGTTVVPYNLFLHAALISQRWNTPSDLAEVRLDTYFAIICGGIVSIAIVICGAQVQGQSVTNAAGLALGLEPVLGSYAKYFMAIGLFAAGITSAITAPLAAAYVACGCMNWSTEMKSTKFRLVWAFVLGVGIIVSSMSISLIDIIRFAQIANGILLPVIAIFLVWIMNKQNVLGDFVNSKKQNTLATLIILFTLFLGIKSIVNVWVKIFA